MVWKKINGELHFWEMGILQNLLKFNGLWPYDEKYGNIKFIMTCGLSFYAAISALIGCFHHDKTESNLFTIFRASLYLHTFLQRCVIKYRKDSLLILFIIMHENWDYSRFLCLRDRNIMINYAKNTKRLILLITLVFTCGTIGKNIKLNYFLFTYYLLDDNFFIFLFVRLDYRSDYNSCEIRKP